MVMTEGGVVAGGLPVLRRAEGIQRSRPGARIWSGWYQYHWRRIAGEHWHATWHILLPCEVEKLSVSDIGPVAALVRLWPVFR